MKSDPVKAVKRNMLLKLITEMNKRDIGNKKKKPELKKDEEDPKEVAPPEEAPEEMSSDDESIEDIVKREFKPRKAHTGKAMMAGLTTKKAAPAKAKKYG